MIEAIQRYLLKHHRQFVYHWFHTHQWARKGIGGHWELWYTDIVHDSFWYKRDFCIHDFPEMPYHLRRPGGVHGTPTCEDWPIPKEK